MYPLLFELGPLSVYSYGVLLATAYILALRFALHRAGLAGLNGQRVLDLGIVGIVSAVVGAKLMLLVVDFDRFTSDLSQMMVLVKSGGVFYGGLLLAVPICWWYMRRGRAFPGRTFWTYLLLYGVARIGIELFRGDPRGMVFDTLPTSQFVSALIVPASIVMLVYLGRRGAAGAAPAPPAPPARRAKRA